MAKAYMISDKQLQEEVLESIHSMMEDFNNFIALETEEFEKDIYKADSNRDDYAPDNISIVKSAIEELKQLKETLLALPIVETIVIKE